jgi:hypothetical protein
LANERACGIVIAHSQIGTGIGRNDLHTESSELAQDDFAHEQASSYAIRSFHQNDAYPIRLQSIEEVSQSGSIGHFLGAAHSFVPVFFDDFDAISLGITKNRIPLTGESIISNL